MQIFMKSSERCAKKTHSEIKQLTFQSTTPMILQYVHTMPSPLSQKEAEDAFYAFFHSHLEIRVIKL